MSARRVLFLPHHFREPTDKGGLRSWHIVNQLERSGPVVVVVPGVDTLTGERSAALSRFRPWASERRSERVEIIRVNALRNDRTSKLRRGLYYVSFSLLQFVRGVFLPGVRVVMTTSMPVSTMLLGWLTARLRGASFIIDVRDLPTDLAIELGYFGNGFFSRLMRRLEYFSYRRADLIVTVSRGMADLLVAGGVDARSVHVAPIGYDALEEADAPTVIFDEVDAGIGGAVAEVVGRKLATLARHRQVLCITHLPQIAAFADHHFAVEKTTAEGRAQRLDLLGRLIDDLDPAVIGDHDAVDAACAAVMAALYAIGYVKSFGEQADGGKVWMPDFPTDADD